MVSSNSEFSQMLQHITDAKLDELSKKRDAFLHHKSATLQKMHLVDSAADKLHILSDGVKECFGIPVVDGRMIRNRSGSKDVEIALANLDRFLKQAQYDPSIASDILERWGKSLLHLLNVQTEKYEYATLFAQLTMEWLSAKKAPSPDGDVCISGDLEQIASARLLESRKQWEESVFKPLDPDPGTIRDFLSQIFTDTPHSVGRPDSGASDNDNRITNALQKLRNKVSEFEASLASSKFNIPTLGWVISGLISSDLLADEQRGVLRDFQNNHTILTELAEHAPGSFGFVVLGRGSAGRTASLP